MDGTYHLMKVNKLCCVKPAVELKFGNILSKYSAQFSLLIFDVNLNLF